ncbi:MAG: 16S rRNA (uracil(1498)-N(3))-methyltransferase [Cyclobacteriaceae bacterium]|nr:16S rRNA (uracil(1498)-N(3))-methyltransferase [Cyclobacteriaceae bacterium]
MEQLFYQPNLATGIDYLGEEESKHCIKVLRKKSGEPFLLTDGKGYYYEATIKEANPKRCTFLVNRKYPEPVHDFNIHLAISPTKNPDRLEWMVEKCVEVGIDAITFIHCENTERPWLKTERLKKVALSAMKQSQRATLPVLSELVPLQEFFKSLPGNTQRFIAHVDASNPDHLVRKVGKGHNYIVLVGPEGDFSPSELEYSQQFDFLKVSLGKNRLRTETAGLFACTVLNLVNS